MRRSVRNLVKIGRATRESAAPLATILRVRSRRGATDPAAVTQASAHPCASCGVCCRSYVVPVCGYDVWRLSRELHLDPERFLVAWQEEEPGTDGFRLDPDGPLFSLVLDKRSWSRQSSSCIFLLRFPGGQDRCGVYQHRPTACRSYPMLLLSGAVALRDDPLCPPGAWSGADARDPAWRDALQQAVMQHDVYRVVVDRWNARIRAESPGTVLDLPAYYRHLLAAYDALVGLGVDETTLAERAATWRTPIAAAAGIENLPWQQHLDRVRVVLQGLGWPGISAGPRRTNEAHASSAAAWRSA